MLKIKDRVDKQLHCHDINGIMMRMLLLKKVTHDTHAVHSYMYRYTYYTACDQELIIKSTKWAAMGA